MTPNEIAALVGAIVTGLTALVTGCAAAIRFYRKAVREEGARISERERAKTYEETSRATIAQKDAEIAALREQNAAWQRIAEQQSHHPPRGGKGLSI